MKMVECGDAVIDRRPEQIGVWRRTTSVTRLKVCTPKRLVTHDCKLWGAISHKASALVANLP